MLSHVFLCLCYSCSFMSFLNLCSNGDIEVFALLVFFSDRTCKIWDLSNSEEILTLDGHPNNVVGVQYAEMTSLIYTVSAYVMKVWDPRRGNVCIKTLTLAAVSSLVFSITRVTLFSLLLMQLSHLCDEALSWYPYHSLVC